MDANENHAITLNLGEDGSGPFLCACGLVCWDSEIALHHVTDPSTPVARLDSIRKEIAVALARVLGVAIPGLR